MGGSGGVGGGPSCFSAFLSLLRAASLAFCSGVSSTVPFEGPIPRAAMALPASSANCDRKFQEHGFLAFAHFQNDDPAEWEKEPQHAARRIEIRPPRLAVAAVSLP